MKTVNFVLSGLGGQGILFMTKILAQAAMEKGYNILGAETHGMAQRGGSVVSHLKIGDAAGSLIRAGAGDFLISVDESEALRYLPYLKNGGMLFTNSRRTNFPDSRVRTYLEKNDIRAYCLDATRTTVELGAPRSANLAMVAFFSGFEQGPLNADDLRDTVAAVTPPAFRPTNLKIFDACYEKGRHQAGQHIAGTQHL